MVSLHTPQFFWFAVVSFWGVGLVYTAGPEGVRKDVVITGTKKGLGIRIVGGRNVKVSDGGESYFGIFIKEIISGSLAERDGEIEVFALKITFNCNL